VDDIDWDVEIAVDTTLKFPCICGHTVTIHKRTYDPDDENSVSPVDDALGKCRKCYMTYRVKCDGSEIFVKTIKKANKHE
jgi:hypothetical protein